MRMTIDYGIDLGTTNSTIACNEGTMPKLIEGPDGDTIMSSVIHVTSDGTVLTGKSARKFIETDPENTTMEFKRLMGTDEIKRFPASGKEFRPEELSAHILSKLLSWTQKVEDVVPKAVVITVPAMFQLPQNEATRRAAQLAGIEYAPLLQEPIAAAIAHSGISEKREGYWMIYDLGGGTFDVSLVRSKEGRLQVIDHDGDNHLGGKDFDRVVAQEAVQLIRKEGKFGDFKRTDPRFAQAFTKLKMEAERLRIFLSEHETAIFKVGNLDITSQEEELHFEMPMDREKLADLIRPTVLRSTSLCKELLIRNKLSAPELNGLVMVGGPTLTPCLPKILQEELQIEAKHHMNPMKIVAYGAALFASTQKLPKQFWLPSGSHPSKNLELQLEFESMTTNPYPILVGRFQSLQESDVGYVQVVRQDGEFDSGKVPIHDNKAFVVDLELKEKSLNLFEIKVFDPTDQLLIAEPSEITIVHGLSVASPPLSQSVGVMLADNSVCWYLHKGVVLPAHHKMNHTTTVSLQRGQSGEAINVPLIQGKSNRADRNKVIGILRIYAQKITIDLPVGTEVEIILSVDELSHTTARAYVPLLDQWFDDVVMFNLESKRPEEVNHALTVQLDRLAELEDLAEELSKEEGQNVDERVQEVEALINEGDRDSIDLADQMVRWMAQKIDNIEDANRVNIIQSEFYQVVKNSQELIQKVGTQQENSELKALAAEFNDAINEEDSKLALDKKKQVSDLFMRVYSRTPEFWLGLFDNLVKTIEKTQAGGETTKILINKGLYAIENKYIDELPQICRDILDMLPSDEKQKITSQIT